ncbi:MAG: polysaccharide deacetylase family protein [Gammaproteobacteria bacterium]|uniref:polysaccharide deacetylase family protein n=1 Tax=Rhodoferax sp. TaxID=50421 RepID=UPI0017E3498A|nr:polysaccharide deacetylase family protein [Rhodoferax sp.]MBU3897491.1 polysaccharide deacetylase family protein [Gammaproteobacteria bacterium]MBA3057999.1 polysaccharide deacetylase family protein [Rhodoferax sp.]MBU3996197.1 polysaccharide deacetylase family protein [Gammaproteobacteria bacterium]MBU4018837.1 polysaccharide deacetylase family protein [Gammaproteobacteria bacterium]MBU4079792.1 polysaccharide deacetylase family protein [Gammaproteobacteria bacterium]
MLLKPMLQCLSPGGARSRLSVLIFHRVLLEPDALFPDEMYARRFDDLCGWLAAWFNVLPLDQAAAHLKAGTLPARAACLTFDDGYADNYHVALPILRRHGLSATFFIATGFLDGGRMWNDSIIESIRACQRPFLDLSGLGLGRQALAGVQERQAAIAALIDQIKYRPAPQRVAMTEQIALLAQVALPHDLMMSSHEVRAMHQAGMQIGAHTVSHPILARLTDEQARDEILAGKQFLEQLLDERVSLFAYPNGKPGEDYTPRSVDLVRGLGFNAAVSTRWGACAVGDDLFQIRRFTPWDTTRLRFGARMLANLCSA